MFTAAALVPLFWAAITGLGTTILGLIGPAGAAIGLNTLGATAVGLTTAGLGTGSALGGGALAAGGGANPFIANGVQNAAADAYNNTVQGSAMLLNGLNLPGIPQFQPR